MLASRTSGDQPGPQVGLGTNVLHQGIGESDTMTDNLQYLQGFGNHFATEALPGALPVGRNSPQHPPYGLIAEQLSGAAFTAKRSENRRTWLYRIRPSVVMDGTFQLRPKGLLRTSPIDEAPSPPTPLRWDPLGPETTSGDFIASLVTMAGNGSAADRRGSAIHIYRTTESMQDRYFYNADGDFLVVPQTGQLTFRTECGTITATPGEIVVIPRGITFSVQVDAGPAYGYVLELYGHNLELPNLGPIGANGLANPRDFVTPTARFEDRTVPSTLLVKFSGELWEAPLAHCPLDVVAWHGNYTPYKYDLRHFNTISTVSYDHPDPSIFTVLTSSSDREGHADADFVIFPARWMVARDTFRPPYFHRNIMSEFMGLIYGVYDAKPAGGFNPGGASLHNCMTAHGPEKAAFEAALKDQLDPVYLDQTLAFMFESSWVYRPTRFALEATALQRNYWHVWRGIAPTFRAGQP